MDPFPSSSAAPAAPGSPDSVAVAYLTCLFALSPDLLAAAGFDGRLKLFNDAWERQLGYTRDELAGTPYLELVHPADLAQTEQIIGRLAAGMAISEYVCRLVRRDGSLMWVAWSGAPAEDAFYIVGRDVTERLALEMEIERRAEQLARANAELQGFAYIASHDLSEPLRTMSGFLGLLERRCADQLDEQARGYLEHAQAGAGRMRQLIDDLLQYSRVANDDSHRESVDLGAVVQEVVGVLGQLVARSGARIDIDPLPVVEADPAQMAQLLQNLIGNAIKFHPEGATPVVSVSAQVTSAGPVLTVSDEGIGIPESDRERIFTMFTRLHGVDEYSGTGIGLAICRRIVERHGGRIWVEPAPGQGSAFRVLLPTLLDSD